MKVHLLGFEMSFASNVTLPEVFQLVESNQKKRHKHYDDEYLYYVDVKDNFVVGLVLRFKDENKSLATSENASGELVVDITELLEGQSGTEVSLFCVNPNTGRGLYYSYQGSLSNNLYRTIWQAPHNIIKKAKINDLTKQYSELGKKDNRKAREKANNECSGHFHLQILTTPEDLNSLLKQFQEIDHLEYTSKSAFSSSGKFQPEGQFIKGGKIDMTFDNPVSNKDRIISYIKDVFGKSIKESDILRLKGMSEIGQELNLVVGENNEDFGKIDFDNYVDLLPQQLWKEYTACAAMDRLTCKISNNSAVFGNIPSNSSWRLPSAATINNELKN